MELNSFLFPAPASSYTVKGAVGDLIYIPRNFDYDKEEGFSESLRSDSYRAYDSQIIENNTETLMIFEEGKLGKFEDNYK